MRTSQSGLGEDAEVEGELRWSTYQTSSSIRSSQGMPARPWTWAQPVIPGQHLVAAFLVRGVVVDLGLDRRAGADDRHLAAEDVDQVGDLVERGAAEEAAGAGDPRVVAVDDLADPDRVGALDHRPQLPHLELAAAEADAALAVDDRAAAARA